MWTLRNAVLAMSGMVALVVAGCAQPTPVERSAACQSTDWYSLGTSDGSQGLPASLREPAFAECAVLGAAADRDSYQMGRSDGLRNYCTAENGYEIGRTGQRYHFVCPPDLEPGFLDALRLGQENRQLTVSATPAPYPHRYPYRYGMPFYGPRYYGPSISFQFGYGGHWNRHGYWGGYY